MQCVVFGISLKFNCGVRFVGIIVVKFPLIGFSSLHQTYDASYDIIIHGMKGVFSLYVDTLTLWRCAPPVPHFFFLSLTCSQIR